MTLRTIASLAAVNLGLLSPAAEAETLKFTYVSQIAIDGDVISASGTLSAKPAAPATYAITDVEGTVNGSSITSFDPSYAYIMGVSINSEFLKVTTASGVGYSFSNQFVSSTAGGYNIGTFTLSSVPIPASAPMFGAALLALGAVGYTAKRKKAA